MVRTSVMRMLVADAMCMASRSSWSPWHIAEQIAASALIAL
jgi:hypothetical protein